MFCFIVNSVLYCKKLIIKFPHNIYNIFLTQIQLTFSHLKLECHVYRDKHLTTRQLTVTYKYCTRRLLTLKVIIIIYSFHNEIYFHFPSTMCLPACRHSYLSPHPPWQIFLTNMSASSPIGISPQPFRRLVGSAPYIL